jgi:hypothetical protein
MTQLSANTTIFDQIAKSIAQFSSDYLSGKFKTKDEMMQKYSEIVRSLSADFQKPLTKVDLFVKGEPPVSSKVNDFSKSLSDDINILSRQIDNLSAKTISTFNLFTQEIENEKRHQERIASKIKILDMYSKSISSDIYYYGDSFENTDFVDFSKIRANLNPNIDNGKFTLPLSSIRKWIPNSTFIRSTNGFIGNNHKVTRSISSEGTEAYRYEFENANSSFQVQAISDSNPATFFEIESVNVDKSDIGNGIPIDQEFLYFSDRPSADVKPVNTYVSWNEDVNTLNATISLTRQTAAPLNCIKIAPFFGSSNILKIASILVFTSDGQSSNVIAEPVYIGRNIVSYDLNIAKNYYHNRATIRFPEISTNRIDIIFEQEDEEDITVQHVYWKTNYEGENTELSPFFGQRRFNPESISLDNYSDIEFDKQTIVPKLSSKNAFKTGVLYKNVTVFLQNRSSGGEKVRFVVPIKTEKEIRTGKRLSIGIRDIEPCYETYSNASQIISTEFLLDYPLESLMLDMDFINNNGNIRSYVSVNGGSTWIEISSIQSGFSGTPEVVAFNKPVSNEYKLPGVSYLNYPDVPEEVTSIIVKIDISKDRNLNTTPEVYSYQLIAKVRK